MAKPRTSFFCQNCGAQASKWIGKCPACNEWNSYVEEVVDPAPANRGRRLTHSTTPQRLNDLMATEDPRIDLKNEELNRVLGGGMVPGSLVLIGGEPGIGKSTLVLQVALNLPDLKILYVSGEESASQIRLRSQRLGTNSQNCFILTETNLTEILHQVTESQPGLVVIDSIQTVFTDRFDSHPGSVGQIRECTNEILRYAKTGNVPFMLVGHINKEGNIAGPKVLEHIVDVVLQFEGDHQHMYRILRSIKNRFGSTSEIGIYEMRSTGLREVLNPSELLLPPTENNLSGTATAATMEGMRPFLIEVQALVSSAVYGTPQRSSTGFDLRRLNMLLAVLEKRAGFHLGSKDVFINIAGGLRVDDPAIDLALISAILSSDQDIPNNRKTCFAGEVALTGEIRAVQRIEQRIGEARKLGFDRIIIPAYNLKTGDALPPGIEITPVSKIEQLFRILFG